MAAKKKAENKLCYVISPIGEDGSDARNEADFLYELAIQPAMPESYEVTRADKETIPGLIDTQIISAMQDADLVIAVLTRHNPNVFYELGIRHAMGKPTVHMIHADQDLPFDASLIRTIKYKTNNPNDYGVAAEELGLHIAACEEDGYEVENPVTRALGRSEAGLHATPLENQVLDVLEGMAEMRSRLIQMEKRIESENLLKVGGREDSLLGGLGGKKEWTEEDKRRFLYRQQALGRSNSPWHIRHLGLDRNED